VGARMIPPAPAGGTGKPLILSFAMVGVPLIKLLSRGVHSLFPLSVSRIVMSFLHPRAFNAFEPMYPAEHPLEHYCDFVYRMIYMPQCLVGPFGERGQYEDWEEDDNKCIEYATTIIQAIGIGTEEQREHLRSIFCPPIDNSMQCMLYGTAGRAENIVNRALWRLQHHLHVQLTPSGRHEIPREVALDFAELRHILGMNGPLYEVDAAYDEMMFEVQRDHALAMRMSDVNPYYD
jgi:hypothetical protein